MADDANTAAGAFNGNTTMMFSSGAQEGFTKTPANVPANFIVPSSKKRKPDTNPNDTPTTNPKKKAKPALPPLTSAPQVSTPGNTTTETQAFGAREKQRRMITKKAAPSRQIPRSFDECDPNDQMLITMRDSGSEWKIIRANWEERTGEKVGASTLPNRYARLKSNFTVIREEDHAKLLEAKREVEESFENQKWDLVARVVKEKGGETYAGVVLQRGYKKMMMSGQGVAPPPGVRDADFDVEMPDGE